MLAWVGDVAVRRKWLVLALGLLFVAVAGVVGGGVAGRLGGGGFSDPAAESSRAAALMEATFDTGDPNLVLLVTAASGNVDDPAVSQAGMALTAELAAEDGVSEVVSYWALGSPPPLRSEDGSQALMLGRITGDDESVAEVIERLGDSYTRADGAITVAVGGQAEVFAEITETVEEDLVRAETIAFPITLVLLVLVFGTVVAAGLPLVVGGIAILGTFLALSLINEVTEVSIFALNLTTALGLGLGIDYSLFVVSRFREELGNGLTTEAAVRRTVATAGRTVAFSALTVAISLGALVVFPLGFLRSFAYAGVAVVLIAGIVAVVILPALLTVLGPRVNSLRLFRHRPVSTESGFWARIATAVMQRPVPFATAVVALLLVLGAPFFQVVFGLSDDRVLSPDNEVRAVQDEIRRGFASDEAATVTVVAADVAGAGEEQIDAYAAELSGLSGVARVDAVTGTFIAGSKVAPPNPLSTRYATGDATWLGVIPSIEPVSPEGEALVTAVRATPAPFDVLVGGPSAGLVDAKDTLFSRVPVAFAIIASVTFVLLFLMFGSVLVPIKALVLNILSLSASFGALVWIFQQGHLSEVLGFTATGTLDITMPILMFCIAFGLSMDYEVFLLSRIKEEYDRTGDNTASVAMGLQKTGRIVTAAAAALSIVLVAFATSSVTFLKMFGIGMTLAVLMDATLVRGILVPAFMRLAGNANWWAPRWMRRIYDRIGISESGEPASATQPEPAEV